MVDTRSNSAPLRTQTADVELIESEKLGQVRFGPAQQQYRKPDLESFQHLRRIMKDLHAKLSLG